MFLQISQERANLRVHEASCQWAMKYMEQWKAKHFINLEELRTAVEGHLSRHAELLRKLSIKFDEELYPYLVSAVAERR